MTRKEAIIQLRLGPGINEDVPEVYNDAVNIAIKALEQEPCDDCISRQAAIDEMGYCQTYLFDTRDKDKKISLEDALYALEQLPSAQPKRGEWIHGKEVSREFIGDACVGILYEDWRCSSCEIKVEEPYKPNWNYCPNCGARMESDTE